MSLKPTREEIIRCKVCKHSCEIMPDGMGRYELCPDGKLNCDHFSQWDYYDDEPGSWLVEPDGFCAWAERDA